MRLRVLQRLKVIILKTCTVVPVVVYLCLRTKETLWTVIKRVRTGEARAAVIKRGVRTGQTRRMVIKRGVRTDETLWTLINRVRTDETRGTVIKRVWGRTHPGERWISLWARPKHCQPTKRSLIIHRAVFIPRHSGRIYTTNITFVSSYASLVESCLEII